jgi:hypothetical protein
MTQRLTWLVTILIFILALYLRCAGLFRGLDQDKIFHPDAPKQVMALENYLQDRYVWYVGSRFYDGYPYFLNHVDEWILRGVWKVVAPFDAALNARSNLLELPQRPQLYRWTAGLRVFYGVIALWLAGLLAFRLFDRRIPAWGVLLLLTIAPLSIAVCHSATGDIGIDLFGAGFFLAAWLYLRHPSLSRIALAGFLAGLAFAAKYNGILLLLMIATLLGLQILFANRSFRTAVGHGLGSFGAFLAGAALATPALFINPKRTLIDLWINLDFIRNYGLPPGFAQKPWIEKARIGLSVSLPEVFAAFGWSLCLLLIAGTLLALWDLWKHRASPADSNTSPRLWIAAAGLFTVAVLGVSALTKPSFQPFHFSYLILPLAVVAIWTLRRLTHFGIIGTMAAVLLSLTLFTETIGMTRWEHFFWRRSDTQVAAQDYAQRRFFESLPAVNRGSDRYAIKQFDIEPFNVAVFRNSPYKVLQDHAEFWRQNPVAPTPWIADPDAGSWMFMNGPVLPRNDRGFTVEPDQDFNRHLVFFGQPPATLRFGFWNGSRPTHLTLRSGKNRLSRFLDPQQTAVLDLKPQIRRISPGAGPDGQDIYLVSLFACSRIGRAQVFVLDSPEAEATFLAFARSITPDTAEAAPPPTPPASWLIPLSETRFVEMPPLTAPLRVTPASAIALTPQPIALMPGAYLLQCRVVFPASTGSVSFIARNGFLPDGFRFTGPDTWSQHASSGPLAGLQTLRFTFNKTDAAPETILEFKVPDASPACEIIDWSLRPDYARETLTSNIPPPAIPIPTETPTPCLTWNQKDFRLQSFSLPITVKRGGSFPIGFRFDLLQPDLPQFDELVIFIHLVREDGTAFPLQGIPFACAALGRGPLNPLLADLPPDLLPGTYRVRMGVYNARTLMRLPIATDAPQVRIHRRAAEWTSLLVE